MGSSLGGNIGTATLFTIIATAVENGWEIFFLLFVLTMFQGKFNTILYFIFLLLFYLFIIFVSFSDVKKKKVTKTRLTDVYKNILDNSPLPTHFLLDFIRFLYDSQSLWYVCFNFASKFVIFMLKNLINLSGLRILSCFLRIILFTGHQI